MDVPKTFVNLTVSIALTRQGCYKLVIRAGKNYKSVTHFNDNNSIADGRVPVITIRDAQIKQIMGQSFRLQLIAHAQQFFADPVRGN